MEVAGGFRQRDPTRLWRTWRWAGAFPVGFGERGQILPDLTGLLRQPLAISENVVVQGLKIL